MAKKDLTEWIGGNAWAILAAAFALYGSYMTGVATTKAEIEKINGRLETIEEDHTARDLKFSGRFDFMNEAASRIELLCGKDADCRARFTPMRVPQ